MSYVGGLSNLEYWSINKSKGKINRGGQYWWHPLKHKTDGKFDGMYMKHSADKYDERVEEKQRNKNPTKM